MKTVKKQISTQVKKIVSVAGPHNFDSSAKVHIAAHANYRVAFLFIPNKPLLLLLETHDTLC